MSADSDTMGMSAASALLLGAYTVLMCAYSARWAYLCWQSSLPKLALLSQAFRSVPADPVENIIVEEVHSRCVQRCRLQCLGCGTLMVICGVSAQLNLLAGKPRWMTAAQDACCITAEVILLLGYAFLHKGNARRRLDLLYVVISLSLTLFMANFSSVNMMMLFGGTAFGLRLMGGTCYLRVWVVSLMQSVHVIILAYAQHIRVQEAPDQALMGSMNFVMLEFSFTFFIVFSSQLVYGCRKAEVRLELEARTFKTEKSAVRLLLDTVCDVVVELDQDLVITDNVPRLSALMLRNRQTSKGMTLKQFMVTEEDRVSFEDHLTSAAGSSSPLAGAFHTKLRDGIGNVVNFEVFHVDFEAVDSARRHLVGIREFTDDPVANLKVGWPSGAEAASPSQSSGGKRAASGASGTPHHVDRRALADPVAEQAAASGADSADSAAAAGDQPGDQPGAAGAGGDQRSESSASSSRTVRSQQSEQGEAPAGHRVTSQRARDVTMAGAMSTWYVRLPNVYCCRFHVTVKEAIRTLKKLSCKPCSQRFPPDINGQCLDCGALGVPEEGGLAMCCVCGSHAVERMQKVTKVVSAL